MNIQEQIEALTQELRRYPELGDKVYFYDEIDDSIEERIYNASTALMDIWDRALSSSTNKAEVEEYADCYRRLKLYQLLGEKAAKEYPLDWSKSTWKYGTDFGFSGQEQGQFPSNIFRGCILGGVWFSREEDRLKALEICGIDKAFQERCAKYGLGGA